MLLFTTQIKRQKKQYIRHNHVINSKHYDAINKFIEHSSNTFF